MKTFLDDKMKHQCMNRCKKKFPERDFFTLVSVENRDYYVDPTDIDEWTEIRKANNSRNFDACVLGLIINVKRIYN